MTKNTRSAIGFAVGTVLGLLTGAGPGCVVFGFFVGSLAGISISSKSAGAANDPTGKKPFPWFWYLMIALAILSILAAVMIPPLQPAHPPK